MARQRKNRQILVLSAATALVAGYAIYDYQAGQRDLKIKEQNSYLIQLKPEQISQMKLKNQAGEFTIAREKDGWKLTSPLQEMADQSAVDNYIDAAVEEKSTTTAVQGDAVHWDQFGLDQPEGVVTFKDNAGAETSLAVGRIKNYQGDAFLKVNNDKKVLIGAKTWFALIDQKLVDFRDKRLFRGSLMGVNKITLHSVKANKSRELILQEKGDAWISLAHPEWLLDQNRVREILSMLSQTSGIEVIADGKIKAQEESEWGFRKPQLTVGLQFEDNKKWQADFAQVKEGSDKKTVVTRVRLSDPPMVLKIAPSDFGKFANIDLESLRDKAQPFQFDRSAVVQMDLTLQKQKRNFKLQDMPNLPAQLHALSAIEFTLEKPQFENSLSFRAKDGKEVFNLQWGHRQMRKYDAVENAVYLAKTSLSPDVFTILAADIDNLKLEQMLTKKQETH